MACWHSTAAGCACRRLMSDRHSAAWQEGMLVAGRQWVPVWVRRQGRPAHTHTLEHGEEPGFSPGTERQEAAAAQQPPCEPHQSSAVPTPHWRPLAPHTRTPRFAPAAPLCPRACWLLRSLGHLHATLLACGAFAALLALQMQAVYLQKVACGTPGMLPLPEPSGRCPRPGCRAVQPARLGHPALGSASQPASNQPAPPSATQPGRMRGAARAALASAPGHPLFNCGC